MIDIKKMRLFPFHTQTIGITAEDDGSNYNVIFYPENTTFASSYKI